MELNPLKKAIKITEGFKSDRIGYLEEYLINSDSKVRSYRCAYAVSQFLSFLDYYKYKNYIELCNVIEKPPRYTRKLVAFSDLIFFGEIINSFENNATVRELNSFFPVLLWWRLTNIIPMRPSEFIEIRTDCLKIDNERYFIKIPRKKLEIKDYGSLEIEDTLPISSYIYNLIFKTLEIKKELKDNSKYLFSKKFINAFGKINHRELEHWTSELQLKVIISKFYDEVVIQRYKADSNIQRIRPGDTRHYAFVNMRLQGFNPLTIARVGGHTRLTTQQHYFKHLNEYADSYVYVLTKLKFLKSFNISSTIVESNESAVIQRGRLYKKEDYDHYHILDPFGACTFDLMNKGCVSDGECRGCPHFHMNREEQMNPKAIKWLTDYSQLMKQQMYEQIAAMQEVTKDLNYNFKQLKWFTNDDKFIQIDEKLVNKSKLLKTKMLKKSICDAIIEVAKNE